MLEAVNKKDKVRLIIENDESVGYYLLVYLIYSDKAIADYLCDSLEEAFIEAEEHCHVERGEFNLLFLNKQGNNYERCS